MNTYVISSKNFDLAKLEIEKIINENKISKFDREEETYEKALGIEDVRNLKKKIFLKPFQGDKKLNVLILKNGATLDSQNSMLKLLEEPPKSSIIILVTDNYHIFLPTILSRVKVIEVKEENKFNGEGLAQILDLESPGDSLYLAQVVGKDKQQAIIWLEDAILSAREMMLKSLDDQKKALELRRLIHQLEIAHFDLKNTNVNTRLALENLFLTIS